MCSAGLANAHMSVCTVNTSYSWHNTLLLAQQLPQDIELAGKLKDCKTKNLKNGFTLKKFLLCILWFFTFPLTSGSISLDNFTFIFQEMLKAQQNLLRHPAYYNTSFLSLLNRRKWIKTRKYVTHELAEVFVLQQSGFSRFVNEKLHYSFT